MGKFEDTAVVATGLPTDLPDAKAAAQTHPEGAIYKSDNGRRYRLRHPKWEIVKVRKLKTARPATETARPATASS